MFRWSPGATAEQRAEAVDSLRAFGREVADLGAVSVGTDAGLAEGNFDVAVVVELANSGAYQRYASDPRHVAVITQKVRPLLGERVAVQYELGA